MRRIRPLTIARSKVSHPHCQAFKADGYACKFPQEINGEGYFTGACANEYHQAQIRERGTDA